MKKTYGKVLVGALVIAAVVVVLVILSKGEVENFAYKYENADLSAEVVGLERTGTYAGYLDEHKDAAYPSDTVSVDVLNYTSEGEVSTYDGYNGRDKSVFTEVGSQITWNVDVAKAGFYNIVLEYLLPQSHGVEAERKVLINGELPFSDAQSICFTRIWTDGGKMRVDNQGNEIRPTQAEIYDWQTAYFRDNRGYYSAPYQFYFEQGNNTITFHGENEPMIISSLQLVGIENAMSYSEYINSCPNVSASASDDFEIKLQGESAQRRSESSLYAKFDRSSPTTEHVYYDEDGKPQIETGNVTYTVLNYTGGDAWSHNGQWIEWDFDVPTDGFYNITIKGRQNYARGSISNRTVYIDGAVPFEELQEVSFLYDNDWQTMTLGDEEGNPFNIYLTAGSHTIRLEASLGGMGTLLQQLEDTTLRLNQIYRKILVYTGANPDIHRDYHIDTSYPEVMQALELEAKRLYKLVDDTVAYCGQKAANIASAQTIAQQIERFLDKPNKITAEFTSFKDNITALGTAALNMSESKLDVDYIVVSGTNVEPEVVKSNVFTRIGHEVKSFFASFFVDYNSVGDVYDDSEDVVKVWILSGRDQGTILKAMIDDTFTPNTGIPINVEIVDAGSLLNAVMAGRGPNVVLSVGGDQPVNYALRGAAEDLTQFDGWQDVFSHYSESSYAQYGLDGHIYGIPETQTFTVMFYRKDVLEELGFDGPPDTWKELIEMLPTIQGNNLSVGLPSAMGSSSSNSMSAGSTSGDLNMYFTLLFQNGGDLYNEAGTKTIVNREEGIEAFDQYMTFFNDYGLPVIYDLVSRFRSGEMPIVVGAYSNYNTLVVSAPEIRGLWDFTLIPGTERTKEDGTTYIDRSDCIVGNATMMITCEDEELKKKSWEFMKWWAQPDTQITFGREIEALLGSSARYATANRDAFASLSWSAEDIAVLNEQWDWTKGIREIPGGYFTGRHLSNACRKVFNEKADPRESIIDYSILIDEEIIKKRREFGLPIDID